MRKRERKSSSKAYNWSLALVFMTDLGLINFIAYYVDTKIKGISSTLLKNMQESLLSYQLFVDSLFLHLFLYSPLLKMVAL